MLAMVMLVAFHSRAQKAPHRKALGNKTHRDSATMEVCLFEMSIPLHACSFSLPIFLYDCVFACTCLSVATSSASCVGSEAWQVDYSGNQFTCGRPEPYLYCTDWTHWGLSPGPSACGADVIPLHHVPLSILSNGSNDSSKTYWHLSFHRLQMEGPRSPIARIGPP